MQQTLLSNQTARRTLLKNDEVSYLSDSPLNSPKNDTIVPQKQLGVAFSGSPTLYIGKSKAAIDAANRLSIWQRRKSDKSGPRRHSNASCEA